MIAECTPMTLLAVSPCHQLVQDRGQQASALAELVDGTRPAHLLVQRDADGGGGRHEVARPDRPAQFPRAVRDQHEVGAPVHQQDQGLGRRVAEHHCRRFGVGDGRRRPGG
jgi:hypothetical protein